MMSHFAKSLARPVLLARTSPAILRNYSTVGMQSLPSSVVVLEYDYAPRLLQTREPFHEAHLFLAKEMIEQGQCIAGGPRAPHGNAAYDGESTQEPNGAFFWFTSLEAAEEFLEKDPYATVPGLVTGYKIYDWTCAVSR